MRAKASWIVAVTGASGIQYALRLIEVLADSEVSLHVVFSDAALRVLHDEVGTKTSHARLAELLFPDPERSTATFYSPRDIGASIASGTFPIDGMVIVPCSMGTLGAVAHGLSENLIHRAADVTLKEGRSLIIAPRETPLTVIHLENMLKLARIGVRIVPAMPGFYHRPADLCELIDMMVMKLLDQMGLNISLVKRWGGDTLGEQPSPPNECPADA